MSIRLLYALLSSLIAFNALAMQSASRALLKRYQQTHSASNGLRAPHAQSESKNQYSSESKKQDSGQAQKTTQRLFTPNYIPSKKTAVGIGTALGVSGAAYYAWQHDEEIKKARRELSTKKADIITKEMIAAIAQENFELFFKLIDDYLQSHSTDQNILLLSKIPEHIPFEMLFFMNSSTMETIARNLHEFGFLKIMSDEQLCKRLIGFFSLVSRCSIEDNDILMYQTEFLNLIQNNIRDICKNNPSFIPVLILFPRDFELKIVKAITPLLKDIINSDKTLYFPLLIFYSRISQENIVDEFSQQICDNIDFNENQLSHLISAFGYANSSSRLSNTTKKILHNHLKNNITKIISHNNRHKELLYMFGYRLSAMELDLLDHYFDAIKHDKNALIFMKNILSKVVKMISMRDSKLFLSKHHNHLIQTEPGQEMLSSLYHEYFESSIPIDHSIVNSFLCSSLPLKHNGCKIMELLLDKSRKQNYFAFITTSSIEKQILEIVKANYTQLLQNNNSTNLIIKLPAIHQALKVHILEHFAEIVIDSQKAENVYNLLSNSIFCSDAELKSIAADPQILEQILPIIARMNPKIIKLLASKNPTNTILQELSIGLPIYHLDEYIRAAATRPKSVTNNHVRSHAQSILALRGLIPNASEAQLAQFSQTIGEKIESLEQQGYVTFVHGQRWTYHLSERWYNRLHHLFEKTQTPTDFLYAHTSKPITDVEILAQENALRKKLISEGVTDHARERCRVLFMNYALWGNSTNSGSSSIYYFFNNANAGLVTSTITSVLDNLNCIGLFNQFEEDFKNLEKLHQKASSYGNMLLIAVPKDKLDEFVYVGKSGGIKNKKYPDIKQVIQDALDSKNTPDKIEFCMPMTWDEQGGLNPKSGVKIFSYNLPEHGPLQEYLEAEKALMEKVEAAIKKSQEPLITEQIANAYQAIRGFFRD